VIDFWSLAQFQRGVRTHTLALAVNHVTNGATPSNGQPSVNESTWALLKSMMKSSKAHLCDNVSLRRGDVSRNRVRLQR